MKMKKTLLYLLAALICLSCEDRADEDSITIDREMLVFPAEGGTLSFQIISNMEWDIITSGRSDSIVVSQRHGTGNQNISVTMPNNTYTVAAQKLLGIRAINGVTKNIVIHQSAKNGSDDLFRIIPSLKYVSGKAGAEVDVLAVCLAPRCFWLMNGGASWLEVTQDGGKTWASAAGQISSAYKEGVDMKFRTTSDNLDQSDREAAFQIYYGTDELKDFSIIQLGSSRAAVESSGILANGIAFSWIYGCDTQKFYVKLTDEDIKFSDITRTSIMKWNKYNASDDLLTWNTGLKESTQYYLYIVTVDKSGNMVKARRPYKTLSSQNQSGADIVDVKQDSKGWTWTTVMNNQAGGYYMWVTDDPQWFDYPDCALVWYINKHLGEMDSFHEDQTHERQGSGPFMIVTSAYDKQGMSSGIINRQIVGK